MPAELPSHESGLRRLISDSVGGDYVAFTSLAEAQQHSDAVAVFEGDDGGQIYAVVLVSEVVCGQPTLEVLLRDLDAIAWPHNDANSAKVFFERRRVGDGIAGGMGGGVVVHGVWVHPEFVELGLDDDIRRVIAAQQDRIMLPGR